MGVNLALGKLYRKNLAIQNEDSDSDTNRLCRRAYRECRPA